MAFADDFPELLVDQLGWRQVIGRDRFDEPNYGAMQSLPAQIEIVTRVIRDRRGEEVVTTGEARVSGIPGISVDDEITLHPAFETELAGAVPPILHVRPQRDYDRAPYMTMVYF